MMNAFPLLGYIGEVRLHHAGRRHRSAKVESRQKSSHVVREATGYWPRPPTRLTDGGDRGQDHVRDNLFILQSHRPEV
jgi:hypothetical protein